MSHDFLFSKKGGQTFPDTVYSSHEAIGREISSAPTPTEDIWISQRPHYRPPCHEKVHLGGSLQPLLQLVLCRVSPGYYLYPCPQKATDRKYNNVCCCSSHCPNLDEDDGIEEEFPTFLRERDDFSVETPLVPQEKKEFLSPVVSPA